MAASNNEEYLAALLFQWVPSQVDPLSVIEWMFPSISLKRTIVTRIEAIADLISKARQRIYDISGLEINTIYMPYTIEQVQRMFQKILDITLALYDFSGIITNHYPKHRLFSVTLQIEKEPLFSVTPVQGITVYSDASQRIVKRLERAFIKDLTNVSLKEALIQLRHLLDNRRDPYFVTHIRSHSVISAGLFEGNKQLQMWLLLSPGGLLTFWVTLHVLRLGSADFTVVGPVRPLRVTVGQDVVLPCHLSPAVDAQGWDIRWIRHDVTETVHHYRNGEELFGEQLEEYAGRTELDTDGLSRGRLDLQIYGLRPSDDGLYTCTVTDGASYGEALVELEVSATGSVPQLSLEGYEAGGIRVLCRSAGWFPQPEVLWKDPDGHRVPSVSQRRSPDARGLFDTEDAIVVTGTRDRIWSCVVRNLRLGQEQEASLRISDPFFHDARPWMAALGVLLTLSVVLLGLGVYLWRRKALLFSRELAALGCDQLSSLLVAWRNFLLCHGTDVVTLDPNTAHPRLVLSQDGRSVRCGSEWQNLPDTPQRFTYRFCVLGREGFSEGRHCWEVEVKGEVGGGSWWALGVARDSVNMKGDIYVSPKEGIWGVGQFEGMFQSLTSPRTPLSLSQVPSRVWVCLDCPRGLVTFIDGHSGAEIFTFPPASFNAETIRPWFWVGTEGTKLCLRDSTSCPPSSLPTDPQSPKPSADPAHAPLLGPAGADVPLGPVPAQGAGGQ
ncbi:butyrophilin subfamily 1 member A1-like [Porphyrio hochstetteri]